MTLAITVSNQIKAYNLAVCPTLPEFLEDAYKNQKSLKKDESFRKRIEVIQGFEFNTASQQIEESKDGQYIVASGMYAPSLKIFETAQLSMKCSRGFDAEIVKFNILDTDYRKIAVACSDRNIEFHAQYGKHYKTRIPKQPTDMVFNPYNCDLLIATQTDTLYRMNLESGSFVESILLDNETGVNCLQLHDDLQLLFLGGNQGITTIDLKSNKAIHRLPVKEITAITASGLNIFSGNKEGTLKVFDLRKHNPISTFQHQYRLPIRKLQYSQKHNMLVSADQKIIKFYNLNNNTLFTNIEPQTEINNFTWVKNSGLFLVAQEQPRMGIYFVPQLDAAPKWCPFLDNLTEELEEEDDQTVYDEYKFLTYEELEQLDALHLMETKMLKQYLHGYLIHLKLYLKLKEQKGFEVEDYRQQRIKKQIAKMTQEEKASKGYKIPEAPQVNDIKITDPRFKAVLEDNDYKIDKKSAQWMRAHPSEGPRKVTKTIHKGRK